MNTMKKIIIREEAENVSIYFDFGLDFPQLGIDYIEEGGYTDADADADWDESVRALIASEPHEDCTEEDFEYVRSLVKAWGL